jgi:ribonuclease-3
MDSRKEVELDLSPEENDRVSLLDELQQALGVRFRNPQRLDLALTHSSVVYEAQREHRPQDDNEQLEFLGDAVLGMVVTEHLFREYPDFSEGVLTRLRSQLVSRQNLGKLGQRLNLGRYLRLGKGEEKNGGRRKSAILANAIEALIAAVYMDAGLPEASRLVREWLFDVQLERLAAAARAGEGVGDCKSELQEYLQAHAMGQPKYEVTAETGPDHRKTFVIAVKIVDGGGQVKTLGSAMGARKKQAEQEAARLALEFLRTTEADRREEVR